MSRKIGVSSAEFSITHCSRRNSGQAKSITYARKPAKIALLLFKLKFTGRRSGLWAWRGLPDGVGRASTVARDRTSARRLRARGQRRTGFEDDRIGGHRGVPRVGESVGGFERLNRHLGATQRVLPGWFNQCPPSPSRRS